ncbi:MAG: hypothetical protein A4E28_01258 [Methanocella sp. PtaU1.Bin125]|nr:MAG: hypothetical protein A4E28_01258 [Methanocella sp. PtaU1.Bin125]
MPSIFLFLSIFYRAEAIDVARERPPGHRIKSACR